MHLVYNDVNDAFNSMIESINNGRIETIKTASKNGPVLQIPEPVTITYLNPRQRVLFNPGRDCNPFFHLYESLWMLAGRNDVAPLKTYASKIDQFSDDGVTFNGAYGYRWRHHEEEFFGMDTETTWKRNSLNQLNIIINHLKRKPESRRVVLQMWNVEDDLLKIDSSKDVCCNTAIYFSIRTTKELNDRYNNLEDAAANGFEDQHVKVLDMTVTNRSNDIVWGMFGANAVHFSFLQEYVACALGIEVGYYHQFSNNAHIYTESNSGFHPEKWLANGLEGMHEHSTPKLFKGDYKKFDEENQRFVEDFSRPSDTAVTYYNRFLNGTAKPMMLAFHYHKAKNPEFAVHWVDRVESPDWRKAATEWIGRRIK